MPSLTTHVLDTARGIPAKELRIDLHRFWGEQRLQISSVVTNSDGRVDGELLLPGELFRKGEYELVFHVGHYLRASNRAIEDNQPFLTIVPVRFLILDRNAHYHVPLLLSPFGYSTYRGS